MPRFIARRSQHVRLSLWSSNLCIISAFLSGRSELCRWFNWIETESKQTWVLVITWTIDRHSNWCRCKTANQHYDSTDSRIQVSQFLFHLIQHISTNWFYSTIFFHLFSGYLKMFPKFWSQPFGLLKLLSWTSNWPKVLRYVEIGEIFYFLILNDVDLLLYRLQFNCHRSDCIWLLVCLAWESFC